MNDVLVADTFTEIFQCVVTVWGPCALHVLRRVCRHWDALVCRQLVPYRRTQWLALLCEAPAGLEFYDWSVAEAMIAPHAFASPFMTAVFDRVCMARHGNLPLLQLFCAHRASWSSDSMTVALLGFFAAYGGHLRLVKWLIHRDRSSYWDLHSLSLGAAAGGRLDILLWLRAQDMAIPWGANLCASAAWGGQKAVARWLRTHGLPVELGAPVCAADDTKRDHLAVLQWLRAQEPPCPWKLEDICLAALKNKDAGMLQWLSTQPHFPRALSLVLAQDTCNDAALVAWIQQQLIKCQSSTLREVSELTLY